MNLNEYYAKIGASFVTKTGYGKYPMGLAKFGTEAEAFDFAQFMRKFKPCQGSIQVVQVTA